MLVYNTLSMNNFKLNYIHLCDDVSFSQEGKLTITGIFDVINVINIPGSLIKAYLVCNFTVLNNYLKEAAINITVNNKKTQEEVVKIPELKVPIPDQDKIIPNRPRVLGVSLQLVNVPFKETGEYNISVVVNEEKVADYIFYVNQIKAEKVVN